MSPVGEAPESESSAPPPERGGRDSGAAPGTLYVIATPIGNLGDLSPRAASALREAELVVAEDTRRTRVLLVHLGLEGKPQRRLDAHAPPEEIDAVAQRVAAGRTVAIVTDAGTPSVSDPGSALVRAARAAGARVVPLPGPSAVTTALCATGYAFGAFRFVGFLPRTGLDRARAIDAIADAPEAVVLFESPSRTAATFADLARAMPGRRATLARELTKLHEEIVEDDLAALTARCAEREVLGEVTIVLAPWQRAVREATDEDVARAIDAAMAAGLRPKDVAERVALETGRAKRDVYDLVVKKRR